MKAALLFCTILALVSAFKFQYGIVIDAGGTKTQAYIYKWPIRHTKEFPLVDATLVSISAKTASLINAGTLAEVTAILTPHINFANTKISAADREESSIFFFATAAVRTLPKATRDTLMTNVQAFFQDTTKNPYFFESTFAKIVSGEEEGAFSWTTVQYLLNTLDSSAPESTSTVLDISCASAQVTFIPSTAPLAHQYTIRAGTHDFDAYSNSFLGFGLDTIEARYRAALVASVAVDALEVNDPCMWKGASLTGTPAYVSLFPSLYPYNARTIKFIGTGDVAACKAMLKEIMFGAALAPEQTPPVCLQPPCSLGGVHQPAFDPAAPLYAIGAFAYSAEFTGCLGESNITCIRDTMEQYMADNIDWATTLTVFSSYSGTSAGQRLLKSMPLNGLTIALLLETGYGIAPDRPIVFASAIDTKSISWTLGAMIQSEGQRNPMPYAPADWTGMWSNDDYGVSTMGFCVDEQTRTGHGSYLVGYIDGVFDPEYTMFTGEWNDPAIDESGPILMTIHHPAANPDALEFSAVYRTWSSPETLYTWASTKDLSAPAPAPQECGGPSAPLTKTASGVWESDDGSFLWTHVEATGYVYSSDQDRMTEEGWAIQNGTTVILSYSYDGAFAGSLIRRLYDDDHMFEFWFTGPLDTLDAASCTGCGTITYTRAAAPAPANLPTWAAYGIAPKAAFPNSVFQGKWTNDDFGVDALTICVDGDVAYGSYMFGLMEGRIQDGVYTGYWYEASASGPFVLRMLPSGEGFTGFFGTEGSAEISDWEAARIDALTPTPEACMKPDLAASVAGRWAYMLDPDVPKEGAPVFDVLVTPTGIMYGSYAGTADFEMGSMISGGHSVVTYWKQGDESGYSFMRTVEPGVIYEFWFSFAADYDYASCIAAGTCGSAFYLRLGDVENPNFATHNLPPAQSYGPQDWTGSWTNDDFGIDTFFICPDLESPRGWGSYGVGYVEGVFSDDYSRFSGMWYEPAAERASGPFLLRLSANATAFTGSFWTTDSANVSAWDAQRLVGEAPTADHCLRPYLGGATGDGHFVEADGTNVLDATITNMRVVFGSYKYTSSEGKTISGAEVGVAQSGGRVLLLSYQEEAEQGTALRVMVEENVMLEFWFQGALADFDAAQCTEDTCGTTHFRRTGDSDFAAAAAFVPALLPLQAAAGSLAAATIVLAVLLLVCVMGFLVVIWCCLKRRVSSPSYPETASPAPEDEFQAGPVPAQM